MPTPKHRKTVKGWAYIDRHGVIYAECGSEKPKYYPILAGSGRVTFAPKYQVLPCTISYSLPAKTKKR